MGLIAGLAVEVIRSHYGKQLRGWWKEWQQKPKRQRQLYPRTPEDCPFCQAYEPEWPTRSSAVRPWREVKSRAGHPKFYDSEGYWCDNLACEYYGTTEAGIHALVSDGWRGKMERIQRAAAYLSRITLKWNFRRFGAAEKIGDYRRK